LKKINYHISLAFYFSAQPLFFDGDLQKKPHIRKCVELPYQQTKAGLWDEVTDTLCNLDFIQAKACAKLTYDLVRDFNEVLEKIPENSENIKQEKTRQERMERYTRDLIAYAKRETKELEIPETVPLWSEDKINDETERIKTNPTRLDYLRDFRNFLGQEASHLQRYALEFPHFTTQQAYNWADSGPVCKNALDKNILNQLLLISIPTRPIWNPLSQVIFKLKGHNSWVNDVAITPNSKKAISVSEHGACIVWDIKTGQAIFKFSEQYSAINSIAITPDFKRAISGSKEGSCFVMDLNENIITKILKGHSGSISSIEITPDGKKAISGSSDNSCILWNLEKGLEILKLKGHTNVVNSVSITPDGKRAFSGSLDNACIIWNLNPFVNRFTYIFKIFKNTSKKILKGHTKSVNAVAITPDGKRAISGSTDMTCIIWDLKTRKAITTLKGHTQSIESVSITPNGKLAISGSRDNTCIIWDLQSGQAINSLSGHYKDITSVALTPDGKKAITGSYDNDLIVWDLNGIKSSNSLKLHTSRVGSVCSSSDGKMAVSGSWDSTCIIWDLITGQTIKTLNLTDCYVYAVALTPDCQRIICGSNDKDCILWEFKTGKITQTLYGHKSAVRKIAILPNGRMAISSSFGLCILWDLNTGQSICTFKEHNSNIHDLVITPDGKRAISGSEGHCIIWDIKTGKVIKHLNKNIHSLTIRPDGRTAISEGQLWDLKTGESINGSTGLPCGLVFFPDGRKAISIDRQVCIIWDLERMKKVGLFVSDTNINDITIFPGGVFGGDDSGKTFILKVTKEFLNLDRCIITIRKIWHFDLQQYLPLSADCPLCGHRFAPPASILTTIENIEKIAGLRPEQSPCLELSNEAWEDPGLLSNCPQCGAELKFNPFIAGGDY
jgi:WD40 repeat protein